MYTGDQHKELIKGKIDSYLDESINGLEIYEILNNLVGDLLKESKFFRLSEVLNIIRNDYINKNNKWNKRV